jgi:hypothetical protein
MALLAVALSMATNSSALMKLTPRACGSRMLTGFTDFCGNRAQMLPSE